VMLFSFALEDLMVDLPLDIVEKPFENEICNNSKRIMSKKNKLVSLSAYIYLHKWTEFITFSLWLSFLLLLYRFFAFHFTILTLNIADI
jgi:hypothetical protein